MCLSKITARYDPPKQGIQTAYKYLIDDIMFPTRSPVVADSKDFLLTPYKEVKILKEGWNTAHKTIIFSKDGHFCYNSGFHVYANKEDALRVRSVLGLYCSYNSIDLFLVEIDNITTEGYDGTSSWLESLNIPNLVVNNLRVIKRLNLELDKT